MIPRYIICRHNPLAPPPVPRRREWHALHAHTCTARNLLKKALVILTTSNTVTVVPMELRSRTKSMLLNKRMVTLSRCRNMLRMLTTAMVLLNFSRNLLHSSESRQPLMSSSTKLKAAVVVVVQSNNTRQIQRARSHTGLYSRSIACAEVGTRHKPSGSIWMCAVIEARKFRWTIYGAVTTTYFVAGDHHGRRKHVDLMVLLLSFAKIPHLPDSLKVASRILQGTHTNEMWHESNKS